MTWHGHSHMGPTVPQRTMKALQLFRGLCGRATSPQPFAPNFTLLTIPEPSLTTIN